MGLGLHAVTTTMITTIIITIVCPFKALRLVLSSWCCHSGNHMSVLSVYTHMIIIIIYMYIIVIYISLTLWIKCNELNDL